MITGNSDEFCDYGVNVKNLCQAPITSEGFSMFPVVYWAKVSETADRYLFVPNINAPENNIYILPLAHY